MTDYIKQWLTKNKIRYSIRNGNIYATKGKSKNFPAFVAHTDTVHKIIQTGLPNNRLHVSEYNDHLFALTPECKQTGIGGDDKVGVYLALRMLKKLDACKVAFFYGEEIGCVGSRQATISFFKDCSFVLQGDRRGYGDFVTEIGGKNLSSEKFQSAVLPILEMYGFKFTSGAMTDVEALANANVGISVANVSCGYYNPHTSSEVVKISDVASVERMFIDIANELSTCRWHNVVERKQKSFDNNWKSGYGFSNTSKNYGGWNGGWSRHFDDVSEDEFNDNGYHWRDGLGWVTEANLYCSTCLDIRLLEKRSSANDERFMCDGCGKFHTHKQALTEDEAIQLLIEEATDKNNSLQ